MATILIPLTDGVEEIEAVTVIDLLRRAELSVTTAALENSPVTGSHNIKMNADVHLKDVKEKLFDMIVLPGGPGTKSLRDSETILNIVRSHFENDRWLAAICAAPTVLNAAGILNGRNVTSFPSEKDTFRNSNYLEETVVVDGKMVTSRGAGTAIPFSLKLIEVLCGSDKADEVARRIVFKIPKK